MDRSIESWDQLLVRYGVPFDSNQCDQNVTEFRPVPRQRHEFAVITGTGLTGTTR